jgi:hypothetical protein
LRHGHFRAGTHLLFTGRPATVPFKLSFTGPVRFVQLEAEPGYGEPETVTLKAYDASDAEIATDAQALFFRVGTFSVSSATANIKLLQRSSRSDRATLMGLLASPSPTIVWGCS